MKCAEAARIEAALRDIPDGTLEILPRGGSAIDARTDGRGRMETVAVFPGIEAAFTAFLGAGIELRHEPRVSVLEVYHCRCGRVGWNMPDGTAIYLGAGDLSLHGMARCAVSSMVFPLGYSEGLSLAIDLDALSSECPDILRDAGFRPCALREKLLDRSPITIPACPAVEGIFEPVYTAPPALRAPWLKLKAQELLLYLSGFQPAASEPARVYAQQTEQIREVHRLLTTHLDQRLTIEELSRRFLINTSALKEGFKAVYGAPIATYMKEARIRRAMQLLRETDDTVAAIAAQVGYESQGKFAQAFKDIAHMLPTEYRRAHRTP